MKWVLIIYWVTFNPIYSPSGMGGGGVGTQPAISTIDGFTSFENCVEAVKNITKPYNGAVSFQCIEVK